MKQTIFTNKNFFKINIDDYASQKEIKVIVESFKECVDIFYTTFNALRKDTKNKASEFETIFGNAESKTMSVVLNSLYEIKALLGSEIKFMRGSFFFDRKHQKHADVLASANLHKKYISIYNPFFEKDFRKEDNRGGVIFHELAHLVGLKDESELNNLRSAECLKNFALLVSGRVSVEDVVDDSSDNVDEVKQDDEELTYSPDQPRAPKGQPNGGQWIDKNGSNSGESSQVNKENISPKNTENNSDKNADISERNSNDFKFKDIYPYEKISTFQGSKSRDVTITPNLDKTPKNEHKDHLIHGDAWNNVNSSKHDKDVIGAWISGDIKIKNFKPNARYGIKFDVEYSYSNNSEFEKKIKKVSIVYDVVSDNKGNILIGRLGVLNVHEFMDDINVFSEIKIKITSSAFEGKPSNLFKISRKDNWTDHETKQEIDDYLISHAINNNATFEYRPKDNCGGKVEKQFQNKNGKSLFEGVIILRPRNNM